LSLSMRRPILSMTNYDELRLLGLALRSVNRTPA
jgi:hypothetical protein